MPYSLYWQIGNVGIIDGLLGKLSDWNMWRSCYQKAWSFTIQIILTRKKMIGLQNLQPLVTKMQNFPSWWITRHTVNKVRCPAWLLPGPCFWPEGWMDFLSCLVVAVLQTVVSKNKAGHMPDWGTRISMHIEDKMFHHWRKGFDAKCDWLKIEDAWNCVP